MFYVIGIYHNYNYDILPRVHDSPYLVLILIFVFFLAQLAMLHYELLPHFVTKPSEFYFTYCNVSTCFNKNDYHYDYDSIRG